MRFGNLTSTVCVSALPDPPEQEVAGKGFCKSPDLAST